MERHAKQFCLEHDVDTDQVARDYQRQLVASIAEAPSRDQPSDEESSFQDLGTDGILDNGMVDGETMDDCPEPCAESTPAASITIAFLASSKSATTTTARSSPREAAVTTTVGATSTSGSSSAEVSGAEASMSKRLCTGIVVLSLFVLSIVGFV
jgi:hypothetical protein